MPPAAHLHRHRVGLHVSLARHRRVARQAALAFYRRVDHRACVPRAHLLLLVRRGRRVAPALHRQVKTLSLASRICSPDSMTKCGACVVNFAVLCVSVVLQSRVALQRRTSLLDAAMRRWMRKLQPRIAPRRRIPLPSFALRKRMQIKPPRMAPRRRTLLLRTQTRRRMRMLLPRVAP